MSISGPASLFFDLGAQKRPTVISIVGAGGKTSTLFWLTRLFQLSGRRVFITTTTHMFLPDPSWPTLFCRDPAGLPYHALMQPVITCFRSWKASEGKARGFSPDAIDALARRSECDVVLVEADGARGMPLKAPDEHEPCIPESSCCVIAVMGGHLLGKSVGAEQVHRWSQFAGMTGLTVGSPLSLKALIRLVQHPQGAFKNTPPASRRVWFLNRFSQSENAIDERELIQPLSDGDVQAIWLGNALETPAIARRFVR